jgi:glycosyltransferase involved in cell wall biosynthesis
VLAIRPLTTQAKYAVDLFISAAKTARSEMQYHLYGNGSNEEVERICAMSNKADVQNLTLHRHFIKNSEIPVLHQQFGIYGAVTRMDAQGVSMCEAMASGLPTVSFDITAISEFITSGENGFLAQPYDLQEFVDYTHELVEDRQLFERIALAGRASMEAIDVRKTCETEIDLAKSL